MERQAGMPDPQLAESIAQLERRLREGPDDRETLLDLAAAYRQAGRVTDAAKLLAARLGNGQPDWEICRGCIECWREANKMEEAVAVLNRFASLYRDRAEFWLLRGQVLEQMGDWEGALREHLLAEGIAPHMAEAHYRRGIALMHLHRGTEAIDAFRQALRLRPRLVQAQVNIGLVLEAEGRGREAMEALQRALAIDPQCAEAHLNLGVLHAEGGQLDAALEHFERALALAPDSSEAAYNAGVVLADQEPDRALRYLRQAVANDPRNLDAYQRMGGIAQQRGLWEAAAGYFRKVVEGDPDRLDVLLTLGLCCSKAERPEEAIEALRAVVAKKPDHAEAWYHLGVCYDKEGEFAKAREAYRQARAHGRGAGTPGEGGA